MKSVFVTNLLLLCLLLFTSYAYKNFPKKLPNCHRYDPNLSTCLKEATEKVKPFVATGIPELGLPGFEPFMIPEINLEQGTSALNFKALLKNVSIFGLTDYTFTRFDFDVPNLQFFCDCNLNQLRLEGLYNITGRILIAPIEGAGTFTASIDNCTASVYQKIKIGQRDGRDFAIITYTNTTIKVGGPKAHLNGLFQGDSALNDFTNKVIDDNVNVLFEEIRPVIEKVLTHILEDLLFKGFANQVPFDQLYPK